MTIALPNSNHPKLAQQSQNYSSNFKTILSPSSSVVPEAAERNMTNRVSRPETSSHFPSPSSVAVNEDQTQHRHNHHNSPPHNPQIVIPKRRWALGTMLMFVLFVLSSSTSSVACVPLGSSSLLELTSIPQEQREEVAGQSGSLSSSGGGGESGMNYMIQPQGQIYLPSLLQQTSEHGLGINLPGPRQGEDSERGAYGQEQPRYSSKPLRQHPQIPQNEDESSRAGWETVIDPHLYLLTEWNSNGDQQQRMRRNVGPSLSIVNPLDVLRQRLLLEIARRKMRQSHNQIMANAEILKSIGRRRRR